MRICTFIVGIGLVVLFLLSVSGSALAYPATSHHRTANRVPAVESPARYDIVVDTGNKRGAGTNANVKIKLGGSAGETSRWLVLNKKGRDDFRRNHSDDFSFTLPDIGQISKVYVYFDHSGKYADWFLAGIKINRNRSIHPRYFAWGRWLTKPGYIVIDRYILFT